MTWEAKSLWKGLAGAFLFVLGGRLVYLQLVVGSNVLFILFPLAAVGCLFLLLWGAIKYLEGRSHPRRVLFLSILSPAVVFSAFITLVVGALALWILKSPPPPELSKEEATQMIAVKPEFQAVGRSLRVEDVRLFWEIDGYKQTEATITFSPVKSNVPVRAVAIFAFAADGWYLRSIWWGDVPRREHLDFGRRNADAR